MTFAAFKGARVVRSHWLDEGGRRLDCNPYMSGAQEARDSIERLTVRKELLRDLTTGIFDSGRESRSWVHDRRFGVPYMGSSAISLADLSTLPLISNRQVARNPRLLLQQSWSLITRSGTIGRMAFVRPEMAGLACSEDVLRVVPNESRVSPGYLFAFLASRYGVPLVVAGTYGAIIQHIEPVHIADLSIPRFDTQLESQVSRLIEEAASLRSAASEARSAAIAEFHRLIGWRGFKKACAGVSVSSIDLLRRMDAFHHSAKVLDGTSALSSMLASRLGDVVEAVFEPNRGARLKVDSPEFGIPFLSSSAVFEVNPTGEYLVSRSRTPNLQSLLLASTDVLLPRSGQLGGIIGRAVLPLEGNWGQAGSEHLVRVRCRSQSDAAYIWAVLASEPGYWSVIGTAYGTSIPSLDSSLVADLRIPWLDEKDRHGIAVIVQEAALAQAVGIQREAEAIRLVEFKIAEGA